MAVPWSGGVKGDSEAVYLVRGSVLSLSFVEPNIRDRPKKPDGPDPRHAPRNVGLQDLTPFLLTQVFMSVDRLSRIGKVSLTPVRPCEYRISIGGLLRR